MPILGINRDNYVGGPGIVRLETSDILVVALAANYLVDQADVISTLNNGPFEFVEGDMVAVAAADGNALCNFLADDFSTLLLLAETQSTVLDYLYLTSAGSGTFLVPAGTQYITYEMAGGGGGGGGCVDAGGGNLYAAAGGGGAGAYSKGLFSGSDLVTSYDYIIGAGGIGGTGAVDGSNGNQTSFGGLNVGGAFGGKACTGIANTAATIIKGGDGGNSYLGTDQLFANGDNGGAGFTILGAIQSGNGGPSIYDVGGTSINTASTASNGFPGVRWGSGGSGGASTTGGTQIGGTGADGALLVIAYGSQI